MSDQPARSTKSRRLFDEPDDGHDIFAAVARGDARLGEILKEVRESHGLALTDISRNLLIREEYLAAIERSDFDRLPGPTYAVGFVRSYADFLGLDDKAAVKLFKSEREGAEAQATLNFPEPVAESRIPRAAILFVSVVLIVVAYGAWYYLSSRDMLSGDVVPQAPEAITSGKPPASDVPPAGGARESVAESPRPGAGQDQGAPRESAPAPETAAEPDAESPAPEAAPSDTVPPAASPPAASSEPPMPNATAPPPSPRPSPAPDAVASPSGSQTAAAKPAIEIRATADSWVQIRGSDGRVVVMRIFRAGDRFKVPDEEGLTLMTGNAGGLEIAVDGKVVPAIGPFGAVRRGVALDPERLRAGTATAR